MEAVVCPGQNIGLLHWKAAYTLILVHIFFYYVPINDTSFELSVLWLSDTEIRINKLRFSDSVSLSFKTRLTSVTCFYGVVTSSKFQAWNQRRKT